MHFCHRTESHVRCM